MSHVPDQHELNRMALFTPCDTKEDLHAWIEYFLDIDLPDCIVDPESTSSPMDFIWEAYSKARDGTDEKFMRVLAYACRDGFKTLGSSIIETLCMLHLHRDVGHMAALEAQAKIATDYMKGYFSRPPLNEFVTTQNERRIDITWYTHKATGIVLNEKEWVRLSPQEQEMFRVEKRYIKVVIATMAGANGLHVPWLTLDELDLASDKAVKEANNIPSAARDPITKERKLPITFLTSTRKFSTGNVQDEIDRAHETGLQIRHWNLIDITEACPPERHRPELPKVALYIEEGNPKFHVDEEGFKALDAARQQQLIKTEGFAGCANCALFASCRSRLATDQKSQSKLLKQLPQTIQKIKENSEEIAAAQLLCWKPSNEGAVYPRLNRDKHMLSAREMAMEITGEDNIPEHFSKDQLIQLMRMRGMTFHSGMDFGFVDEFAVVTGGLDGHRLFIFDVIGLVGTELPERIEACDVRIKHLDPTIYPDQAYPADIKTFKRHGYRMMKFTKDVQAGIEAVRWKLTPGFNKQPEIFFLRDDTGCERLFDQMSRYYFRIDATSNRVTDQPRDGDDDLCFTRDTEVLTSDGWKSLEEVSEDDLVAAVTSDGNLVIEKPLKIIKKKHSGKMYKIDHPHLEFDATEDHAHAVMTQYDWKVLKNYRLQKKTVEGMAGEMYWANNLSQWPTGSGFFAQGKDEAWFAGFWLAEGCFDSGRPSYLIVDQKKPQHQATVRSVLDRLGWTYSETHKGNGTVRFVVSGQKDRASVWENIFGSGAQNKKLPWEILIEMSKEEREFLWEGYMAGDGCRTGSSWHFDTTSKSLADGIQILSLMLGYGCRIVTYDCMKEGSPVTLPGGRRSTRKESYRGHVLRKTPVAHIKKSRFETYSGDVDVFCVRTSTGFFFARTAGKPFVAGNCDALRYLCQNLFGGKRLLVAQDKPKEADVDPYAAIFGHKIHQDQMRNKIREAAGLPPDAPLTDAPRNGKRGNFFFSFD